MRANRPTDNLQKNTRHFLTLYVVHVYCQEVYRVVL